MTGYEWATLRNEGELSPRQIRMLDFLRWRVRTGRLVEGAPGVMLAQAVPPLPSYVTSPEEDAMIAAYRQAARCGS